MRTLLHAVFYCFLLFLSITATDLPGFTFQHAFFSTHPLTKYVDSNLKPYGDINFDLYTHKNREVPTRLDPYNDTALLKSFINFSAPTVFFFHGFLESSSTPDSLAIRDAYLKRKEFHNIFLVNAKNLVAGVWYFTSIRNTVVIGSWTAEFIEYLVSRGLDLSNIHLIGHSLGSHMAGNTGSRLRTGQVSRITGLDPAGPFISNLPDSMKLDASDAEFVDVIHTDAGKNGYVDKVGHVDFWPNGGGATQPGCSMLAIFIRNPMGILEQIFCSHWRSYLFYAESVNDEKAFFSRECLSWSIFNRGYCKETPTVYMGYSTKNTTIPGNYYLHTNGESPYSRKN